MSSKKTTTTNQTQNTAQTSTSTPNVPTWISNPTQALAGQISGMEQGGAAAYTPGISALQQQAALSAGNLSTSPYFTQAGGVLSNLPQANAGGSTAAINNGGAVDPVTGQSLLTNLQSYYNPFEQAVVDPVMQQYDYNAGQQTAQQEAQAALTGSFGGSRNAITASQLQQQLALGRSSTLGGLLNQAYTSATGLSEQDAQARQQALLANQQAQENTAGRTLTAEQANQQAQLADAARVLAASQSNQGAALQSAGLLTNLGTAQGAQQLQDVQTQDTIGAQFTDLQNAIKQYPLTYQAQMESLLSGLNPALYTGQTQSGTGTATMKGTTTQTDSPGLLSYLGTAAQIGSMFAGGPTSAASGIANLFSPTKNTAASFVPT